MVQVETVRDGDKSFAKLFELIELIAASRDGLKGKELAERSGIPTSTTFRMLKFLADKGYLRNDSGRYALGPALVRMGVIAQEQNPLPRLAHPLLAELAEQTRETVHLAALRGNFVCYFDKVEGSRSVRMGSLIGSSAPLYCTGVGKAILAFLPDGPRRKLLEQQAFTRWTDSTLTSCAALAADLVEVRRRGYAIDNCEHEQGVFCVAAPILDAAHQAVAAVSVSGSELYLRAECEMLAAQVRETARRISARLQGC